MNRPFALLAIACACLVARSAHADVIIEASVGERTAKADEYMTALRAILVRDLHESLRREDVIARFRDLPRPGITDPTQTAAKIIDEIEIGYKSVLQGNFKEASTALSAQLENARDNAGVFVLDPNARTEITRALVGLGISRYRSGDSAGGAEAFAELARTTGGQPLRGFGSEAEKLYNQASSPLLKLPRGKLLVSVSEPDAQIFVDEVGSGRGGTFSADMIPGLYRVLVMVKDTSLRYNVTISSNKETKLDIDWQLETALVVSPSSIALRLRSETERRRLPSYVARLAERGNIEQSITVFIVTSECDRIALSGARFDRSKQWQRARGGKILLTRPDTIAIRKLVLSVLKNEPSPDVLTDESATGECPPEESTVVDTTEHVTSGRAWMKWTGIAGIGVGIVGGAFAIKFARDSRDAGAEFDRVCAVMCTSEQARNLLDAQSSANRNLTIAGIAGGAAVVTGGVFLGLWYRSPRVRVALLPSRRSSMAALSFSF